VNHPKYKDAVRELEALPIMPARAPSLEPTCEGLKRLGLPKFPASRVVIVAGTNGKGTVCACLEALLLQAGQTTGLYTSPHLEETTERFRLNGDDVSEAEFVETYETVREKTRGLPLTHFEILTLMAYSMFSHHSVDWMILEVGLGGLWDATNAIAHETCVITQLGLDHQNLLGSTLSEIAANKFGVIESGATVIHSPFPAEISPLVERTRLAKRARFIPSVDFESTSTLDGPDCDEPQFWISTRFGRTRLSLPGPRAAQNAATALTTFEALGFDPARSLEALSRIRWPGRMEKVEIPGAPCPVYLSGDHNPQGIASLLELLKAYPRKQLHLLVGVGKDKDLDGILTPLRELKDTRIVLTETPFRGQGLSEYGRWLELSDGACADPQEALEAMFRDAGSDDLIVVTGSLYLVGAIRKFSR